MDSLIVSENIISDNLTDALQEWENLLGSEYVSTDNKKRLEAETATYETHAKIPAIIRPGNRQEVQESLKIANRYQTPVYPISTGKNWGYGSRVPSRTGSVLMDLSRLNQILDYNETLAYVTIEAGVTQRQLYDFLQKIVELSLSNTRFNSYLLAMFSNEVKPKEFWAIALIMSVEWK